MAAFVLLSVCFGALIYLDLRPKWQTGKRSIFWVTSLMTVASYVLLLFAIA